ncbi:MAG: hypothetical protein KBT34_08770 [Prevotella sp.]|nr:hypothetical protein [Candidatus Prevotella equi]
MKKKRTKKTKTDNKAIEAGLRTLSVLNAIGLTPDETKEFLIALNCTVLEQVSKVTSEDSTDLLAFVTASTIKNLIQKDGRKTS